MCLSLDLISSSSALVITTRSTHATPSPATMARGNEREKARAKNLAKQQKAAKSAGHSAPKAGGANADADALKAKIAAKAKAKADGVAFGKDAKKSKDKGPGTKALDGSIVKKDKGSSVVNPHTGKKDAKWNAKVKRKGAGKGELKLG